MGIADILTRLDRVRQSSPGHWRAICPAHASKHRSLTLQISERPDGAIGLYCHAGCETRTVVHCLGLTLSDLFDERVIHQTLKPRRMFSPVDALESLAQEGSVVLMAGAMILEKQTLTEADWKRLTVAQGKINSAWELFRGR